MAITVNCAVLPWHTDSRAPGNSYSGLKAQCGSRRLLWSRHRHLNLQSKHIKSHGTSGPRCWKGEPPIVRLAVSAVTELLRAWPTEVARSAASSPDAEEDISDPLRVLTADYERSYFVTGEFCSSLYRDDCLFVDPTISFTGRETYKRNLKLLVPFLVDPSVELLSMAEGEVGGRKFIITFWTLRSYVKLPWMPLINVDGSTVYDLDADCPPRVTRHEERWSIPAWEAICQMFVPSDRNW